MMSDRYDENLFLGYVEGELTPDQRAQFEALMTQDPVLRRLVRQVAADRQAMREWPDEVAPPQILETVRARLERVMLLDGPTLKLADARAQAQGMRSYRLSRWTAYGAVAALVCVGTAIVWVTLGQRGHLGGTPTAGGGGNGGPGAVALHHDPKPPAGVDESTDRKLAGAVTGDKAKELEGLVASGRATRLERGHDGQFAALLTEETDADAVTQRAAAGEGGGAALSATHQAPGMAFGAATPAGGIMKTAEPPQIARGDPATLSANLDPLGQMRMEVAADDVDASRGRLLAWAASNDVPLLDERGDHRDKPEGISRQIGKVPVAAPKAVGAAPAGPVDPTGGTVGKGGGAGPGMVDALRLPDAHAADLQANTGAAQARGQGSRSDELALVIPAEKVAALLSHLNGTGGQEAGLVQSLPATPRKDQSGARPQGGGLGGAMPRPDAGQPVVSAMTGQPATMQPTDPATAPAAASPAPAGTMPPVRLLDEARKARLAQGLAATDWGAIMAAALPLEPTAPVFEPETQLVLPVVIYNRQAAAERAAAEVQK